MSTVIVFGPTGNVASAAAIKAQEQGAKVILAMRDPKKTIPGLSAEKEKQGGFERIQADLSDPQSAAAAVKATSAKRAFLYCVHGLADHLRATLEALKEAGIEFVVFLSSYTVSGEPRDIAPSEAIPYVHARVEINLQEVFGNDKFVAIRPGGFATNILRFSHGIKAGHVKLFGGSFPLDCITPNDMGEVSGTVLANGPKAGQQHVYLYGPQLYSQKSAVEIVGKVVGKQVETSDMTAQECLDQFAQHGIPKPLADYMVRNLGQPSDDKNSRPNYDEGVANVQLYLGRPATKFEEWVEASRAAFV